VKASVVFALRPTAPDNEERELERGWPLQEAWAHRGHGKLRLERGREDAETPAATDFREDPQINFRFPDAKRT